MNKSIWEWLEIEPTGEISEIRAAYARQVKKYHPEDTPEEFEQLQKAYKSALRQARAAKRMETVPQSVQESQKSGSGFEKRDMPGFFENAGMTEEPNVPSWENTGSMSGVTSEPGTTPDLEIAGTPDEVESEIVSDSEYDFAEVGKDEPEQQCLKEIEYIIMNPYLRNTEEAWNIFFNRERYRQLFKQQEFCEKMQDRICRMWGLQRKTLFLIEQQFKAEGYEQLIEKKEWKQKKSFIRNLHIISYKNKKTQKQKNLNKLLENQTMKAILSKGKKQLAKPPQGKQSLKQLMKQNAGVSNIEITEGNIKAFESTAKKYGIDFALKKDATESPPRYLVFFKGRDADVLTAAFKEFSAKKLTQEKKPSIRKLLSTLKEAAQGKNAERAKVKNKDREVSL